MADYLTFEGRIEPLIWGDKTYTILPLPAEISGALRAAGARRVEGEIAEHRVNLALTTAPVTPATFLWTGKSFLQAAGLSPGETVEVRLRPASDTAVEIPADVAQALRTAGLTAPWEALTPGRRRGLLHQIDSAKRAETRGKRIAKLLVELR